MGEYLGSLVLVILNGFALNTLVSSPCNFGWFSLVHMLYSTHCHITSIERQTMFLAPELLGYFEFGHWTIFFYWSYSQFFNGRLSVDKVVDLAFSSITYACFMTRQSNDWYLLKKTICIFFSIQLITLLLFIFFSTVLTRMSEF